MLSFALLHLLFFRDQYVSIENISIDDVNQLLIDIAVNEFMFV